MVGNLRRSLTKEHKALLARINAQMPMDLSVYTLPEIGVMGKTPSFDTIAASVGASPDRLRTQMQAIEQRLGLPDTFIQGDFDLDTARARRLARQYRQRYDERTGDVRDRDKTFLLMGELGLATRLIDPDVFKGLALAVVAYGYDQTLSGVVGQGGMMPDIPAYWSVTNQDKAIVAGSAANNNSEGRFNLERMLSEERLDEKGKDYLRREVAGTVNRLEEAAVLAADQIAPLVEVLPKGVDFIAQWGISDYFNMREMLKYFIEEQAKLMEGQAKIAKIPEIKDELASLSALYATHVMGQATGDRIVSKLSLPSHRNAPSGPERVAYVKERILGPEWQKKMHTIFTSNYEPPVESWEDYAKRIREETDDTPTIAGWKRSNERDVKEKTEEAFRKAIDTVAQMYVSGNLLTPAQFKNKAEVEARSVDRTGAKIATLKDKLADLTDLSARIEAESSAGIAWFTKQYALTNTDAKAMNLIIKTRYAEIYDQIERRIQEVTGRKDFKLNVLKRIKADLDIGGDRPLDQSRSVFTVGSDDDELAGAAATAKVDGVNIALVLSPNFVRSQEPVKGNLRALQGMTEEAITRQIALGRKPGQFEGMADADIVVSSYGAGAFFIQPRPKADETLIPGEYRPTPEYTIFIKNGVVLDETKLKRAEAHGNRGHWGVRRYQKGEHASLVTFLTKGADGIDTYRTFGTKGRDEEIHAGADDRHPIGLADIGKMYHARFRDIEQRLAASKGDERAALERERDGLLAKVRADLDIVMLEMDTHYGVNHTPGRPTNEQVTRAASLAFADRFGVPKAIIGTENLHGRLKFRSFDSTAQDYYAPSRRAHDERYDALDQAFHDGRISPEVYRLMHFLWSREADAIRGVHALDRQKEIFRNELMPFLEEMMLKGAVFVHGSGNHPQDLRGAVDEADAISQLFNPAYLRLGRYHRIETGYGNDQSVGQMYVPGTDVVAQVFHKMWHGSTEIELMAKQMLGTRAMARLVFTGDRHQGGAFVAGDRAGWLDFGKQPTNSYVAQIGKPGSLRGTLYGEFSEKHAYVYGGGFALDPVIDRIISWDQEASLLRQAHLIQTQHIHESAKGELARSAAGLRRLADAATAGEYDLAKGNAILPPSTT